MRESNYIMYHNFTLGILGSMIISLLMNITMNQLGGASVIAKFHS